MQFNRYQFWVKVDGTRLAAENMKIYQGVEHGEADGKFGRSYIMQVDIYRSAKLLKVLLARCPLNFKRVM
ncbi:MAG: hypothetical protein GX325_10775 [Peptococcaceae bacterium]|nr:hypothetical protein [Peptococcaceae bacterium]